MKEARSQALVAWLAQFVRDASTDDHIERFVAQVDDVILRENPQIAEDPMLVLDLHNSTRTQWRAFLVTLVEPEHRLMLPESATELARSVARRGLELGVLLKVYRAGQQALFGYLTDLTEGLQPGDPGRDRVLVDIWNRADRWLDGGIERLIAVYYEERQRLHEGSEQRKTETITAILGGAALQTAEASRALGYPVHAWQTAFVSWTAAETSDRPDAAYAMAVAAAEVLGTSDPLTMAAGSRDLWFWVATDDCPDLAALASLRGPLEQSAAQLAVGIPAKGVSGFRDSQEEARAAQALAISATSNLAIVLYQDVELLCLTSGNRNLTTRMAQRELKALAGADKNIVLIRDTVLAFFESGLNVEATAQRLYVHKNTIRYRLARAEELIGHSLSDRTAHLELALRYVSMFGSL